MTKMGMTKEQFSKLDVLEQGRIKWKFLQAHFSAFVRIQASNVLEHLAEVLHMNDMEQIERDMQNKSNNIVMQNLLMRLSRTCKPWWIPLEKYLLEEGDNKLYSFLNPWRDLEEHGATAASPDVFFRNSDRSSGGIQRPYSCDTPLGKTSGLVDVLRSCPWRMLADVLGFNMDEQLAVKRSASCDNDFHQHLIDAYIEKYRSNATVGSMVQALLRLNAEGSHILSFMEEAKLIVVEREGSEAGEVRGEELHRFNITESASGASAGTRQTNLFLNRSPYSLRTTVTNNCSAYVPMNGSSANDHFPSSAFHSNDRVVSRNNQESVSTWHVQEARHRLASSPGTTQPSQVNQEMEIPIDSTSCRNSEPGNFTDYETPPNILEESDLMQSLADNASQPGAGDVKDLNIENHTEDKAYPQKYCNPSHPTDDQEDGDNSFLQTDGPCEVLPTTASACSDFTDGRDSSTAPSHYSQQPASDVPSAAELVGSTPQPGNSNSNITINLNLHNCKGPILNFGQKNKVNLDLPMLQEQTYEADEDRDQEFDAVFPSVSSPAEAKSDTGFCPQECQQGIRDCPTRLISARQNLVTEGEALPWNPNLHQTIPKQIVESESEAAPRQVTEMDLGDANDVSLMLNRKLIPKAPEEQVLHGHEDATFSTNAAAKSSQAVKSPCHQISNSGNSRSQHEEANAEDTADIGSEKEGLTLTASLTHKQCEGQQDQPQQSSGLLKRFSYLLKDVLNFME